MKRLSLALVIGVALSLAPSAGAWSWPLDGDVLRPYSLGANAYAAGQHRGVDVAGANGEHVRAPATGTVSFAGTVPTYGRTVTIQSEGYSVSLTHLGAIAVAKGAAVVEGDPIGTTGLSGESEWSTPYVHLGIRTSDGADGYVDPMTLLPPRALAPPPAATSESAPAPSVPAASAPSPVVSPVPLVPPTVGSSVSAAAAAAGSSASVADPVSVGPSVTGSAATAPSRTPVATASAGVTASFVDAPTGSIVRSIAPAKLGRSSLSHRSVAHRTELAGTMTAPGVRTRAHSSANGRIAQARGSDATRNTAVVPRRASTHDGAELDSAASDDRVFAERSGGDGAVVRDSRREGAPRSRVAASVGGVMPAPSVQVPTRPDAVNAAIASDRVRAGARFTRVAIAALLFLVLLACTGVVVTRKRMSSLGMARMMTAHDRAAKDPGCSGVAVCERPPSHRPRGRVRRSVGHLRALSPTPGQRRPDGERDRRARNADHGRSRPGRHLSA